MHRLDRLPAGGGPRLQLVHVRRPRDADPARLPRRSDEVPHPARRQRDVPRLPPARRRDPVAVQPARRPDRTTTRHGPRQDAEGAGLARPPASIRSPSARASPTTSRSRAAPAACSRAPATSSSTATSPSTTSRACGASGASSTPCSPTSRRCPTARPADAGHSTSLIGKTMPDGTTLTEATTSTPGSRRSCRRRAAPRRPGRHGLGLAHRRQGDPDRRCYLGEPEDTTAWADYTNVEDRDDRRTSGTRARCPATSSSGQPPRSCSTRSTGARRSR